MSKPRFDRSVVCMYEPGPREYAELMRLLAREFLSDGASFVHMKIKTKRFVPECGPVSALWRIKAHFDVKDADGNILEPCPDVAGMLYCQ